MVRNKDDFERKQYVSFQNYIDLKYRKIVIGKMCGKQLSMLGKKLNTH